jgi:transposase InsO family protein
MRAIARALDVSRSNLAVKLKAPKRKPTKRKGDEELLKKIHAVIEERKSYGYRRVSVLINGQMKKQGCSGVNRKRVYRLMKENHLLLSRPFFKPQRSHTGKVHTLVSNTRWCSDSFVIQCHNGDRVYVAFSLDTCDREAMRYVASTIGIDGQAIRDLMMETVEYRLGSPNLNSPIQWLTDNGSCYTARETVAFGRQLGLDIRTTPAYSPESNGMAESFVKTFKRDYVWLSDLKDARTVMSQLPKWMEDYNETAPHKALKMLSPREFLRLQKRVG